jgi:hypothetical protein
MDRSQLLCITNFIPKNQLKTLMLLPNTSKEIIPGAILYAIRFESFTYFCDAMRQIFSLIWRL